MATFKQLKKEIEKGKLSNIYILTGEEKEVMRKYIKQIDPKYVTAESLQQIIPKLKAKSLVSMNMTYVIKEDKDAVKLKLEELEQLVGGNRLILVYDASDARLSLFKTGKGVTYTFDRIKNSEAYVSQLIDVEPEVAKLIADRCGGSISKIELEVDKLKRLDAPITAPVVEDLISQTAENRIWEFIDKVLSNDYDGVFQYYAELKELKESEVKFVSLLFNGFKNIILVQGMASMDSKVIAEKTGLQTWAVGKTKALINKVSMEKLIQNLGLVHRLEIGIKTGRVDAELGFKNLLVDLLW